MKKLIHFGAWMIFTVLTVFLLIYTYALCAPLGLDEQRQHITLYDCKGSIYYESNFGESSEWTSLNDIPKIVQDAFVAVEDKRFYDHFGFDPIRMTKAVISNLFSDSILQGGSTITQQYAKNLFLTNEQTLTRKIEEFFYAARLEMHYTKQDILEGYLNTLYFGHGVIGIKEAASYYFGKDLEHLDAGELAMLVGVVNGPGIFSPYINYENAVARQKTILQIMYEEDLISKQEYEAESNKEVIVIDHSKDENSDDLRSYYIDAVLQELDRMDLQEKNISVQTYFDPDASTALYKSIQESLPANSQMQVSAVILEPFTNHTLAIAGGSGYTTSQYNRAFYAKRQIASTIKPLLYYCALLQGFTPSTSFISQPTTFQLGNGETYAPGNYADQYPYREISMINAIAVSDNIYAVKTHLFLGEETLQNALSQYGIQAEANASLALGTVNMSIAELASIYNSFASEGLYARPQLIQRIQNEDQVIYQDETQLKQLLYRDETLMLSQMLTATYDQKNTTSAYPSMLSYSPDVKTAVKSGTSNWDSLVAGYNPQYTVAIWTGYDDNRELEKEDLSYAKAIYKATFDRLYENRKAPWYYPSQNLVERRVDPISGKDSADGSVYWYKKGSKQE